MIYKTYIIFLVNLLILPLYNFQNVTTIEIVQKNNFLKGIFKIESNLNGKSLKILDDKLILFENQTSFRLINYYNDEYYIETNIGKRRIGIDKNNSIVFYSKKFFDKKSNNIVIWEIIQLNNINKYVIKNKFNKKFLESNDNNTMQCLNNFEINDINLAKNTSNKFIFSFIKLFDEYQYNKTHIPFVKNEPIDLVIKYIDLTDKTLKREGIIQIYKDMDNEELKYSIRSIIQYIPWIRKIYILMPNKKVKYFKQIDSKNDKIMYINDKDFLGYDSANIFAFTFNLFKLEKYGVSKNFIYMEDDFFIGKELKKSDFFYYDEKSNKVVPFLLQKYFYQMNENEMIKKRNELVQNINYIYPHSSLGWWFSVYNTNIYFMHKFESKIPFINTKFNHVARPENIDDLKEIFNTIKDYEHINDTLYSKTRHIWTLNQPHYENIYQLNIKKKFNHYIPYNYIKVEYLNNADLFFPLYVINTGGNHEPFKRQFLLQKKIMKKRYPYKTNFELYGNVNKNNKVKIKRKFNQSIRGLIIIILLKYFYILEPKPLETDSWIEL